MTEKPKYLPEKPKPFRPWEPQFYIAEKPRPGKPQMEPHTSPGSLPKIQQRKRKAWARRLKR